MWLPTFKTNGRACEGPIKARFSCCAMIFCVVQLAFAAFVDVDVERRHTCCFSSWSGTRAKKRLDTLASLSRLSAKTSQRTSEFLQFLQR